MKPLVYKISGEIPKHTPGNTLGGPKQRTDGDKIFFNCEKIRGLNYYSGFIVFAEVFLLSHFLVLVLHHSTGLISLNIAQIYGAWHASPELLVDFYTRSPLEEVGASTRLVTFA